MSPEGWRGDRVGKDRWRGCSESRRLVKLIEEKRSVTCNFRASLKHKNDGQTKFIIIKYKI